MKTSREHGLEADGSLRLALYARTSTDDLQEPETSFGWQRDVAGQLTAGSGEIVATFWDRDTSRSVPLHLRPESRRMIQEMSRPGRDFDALVIGEGARAFGEAGQVGYLVDMCRHHHVRLFVGGKGEVDLESPIDKLYLTLVGGLSEHERAQITARVRNGMSAIARREERFLGGRTPYGYLLIDIMGADGRPIPHPNAKKAAYGARLRKLAPDPEVAWVVARIFTEYSAGRGYQSIVAQGLTDEGILSPSAYRPEQNQRRDGRSVLRQWCDNAVRAILLNPVYTGRRVWAKQRRVEVLRDGLDAHQGKKRVMRWNDPENWVVPIDLTHEPLVAEETFQAVQERMTARRRGPQEHPAKRGRARYALGGRVRCAACLRKMEASRPKGPDGPAYFKCRVTERSYARPVGDDHPKGYLRESLAVAAVNTWLTGLCNRRNVDKIVEAYMASVAVPPADPEAERLRREIAAADQKIRGLTTALVEHATDAPLTAKHLAQCIQETEQDKASAQRRLARLATPQRVPTREEIRASVRRLVDQLNETVDLLQAAGPDVLADVYDELGLQVLYRPGSKTIRVRIPADGSIPDEHWPQPRSLTPQGGGGTRVSEGGLEPPRPCGH
jgi:DNA invertase Pin-like site-specific DNA recombinase